MQVWAGERVLAALLWINHVNAVLEYCNTQTPRSLQECKSSTDTACIFLGIDELFSNYGIVSQELCFMINGGCN